MSSIEQIKKDLKNKLSEYRYIHSLNVARLAKSLAKRYGVDEEKAYLAGLVHDIAKEFTDKENAYYIKKYRLKSNLLKEKYKYLLHGIIGSLYLKDKYGLDDEICNAVMVHTIGDENMTMLDKILFVADKTEPNKNFNGTEEERKLSYINIDKTLVLCLENYVNSRKEKGKKVNKKTLNVIKHYKKG